ncbi:MAG: hypothetical protein ACRC8G_10005 [Plesiomonas shigelloides]
MEIPGTGAPECPKHPTKRYVIVSEISGSIQVLVGYTGSSSEFSSDPNRLAYLFESFADAASRAYHTGGRIVRVG